MANARRRSLPIEAMLVVTAALVVYQALLFRLATPPVAQSDFGMLYYAATHAGADMYAPAPDAPRRGVVQLRNMNPPHLHLLVLPLTRWPLATAALIWRLIGWACAAGCLAWIVRTHATSFTWIDYALLLAWAPLTSMLTTNQVTFILWPLLIATLASWRCERWSLGAIPLGLAASVKPFLGLVLVWLVLRRQWRATGIAGLSIAVAFAGGVAVFGIRAQLAWVATLGAVDWPWALSNASLLGPVSRALSAGSWYGPLVDAPGYIPTAWIIASAIVLGVTARVCWRRSVLAAWPTLITAALLVSPLGWIYYAWWALPGLDRTTLRRAAPLFAVPLIAVSSGQPNPWLTVTLGSVYTYGLLVLWLGTITHGHQNIL